jgi:hypothetical protein
LEGVEARTIERINTAQINNVFVATDRFAEFVGLPCHVGGGLAVTDL